MRPYQQFIVEVSVLFSEPKIPQFKDVPASAALLNEFQCSSASRKFLNQDTDRYRAYCAAVSVLFSEPKIPQWKRDPSLAGVQERFSALQRAENSSIHPLRRRDQRLNRFQCSSASRKFLNLKC